MVALKEISKQDKLQFIIISSIISVSILSGIFVGLNEDWFISRNFTAGYMAGSLMTVIVLFSIYRSIAFFFEKKNNHNEQ
ncbi:hypothetical protein CR194_00230 [Salipaludibacillus keqinensis]|uniref:Uncharacterized protein n=1 Tax=Salipaludibacillus keqinensis TaxID=2045207 RepID=A0A323TIJ0_9BACI|nr:hypothetical protein [Salipaludibacillus keqinensis]PYZ94006.1 hypothetical protein CR194_00230 [Salipaludibacillus keqinensis]